MNIMNTDRRKNIIFDFGNVLVRWEPERYYTNYFGDEAVAAHFLREVATPAWRNGIDAGRPHAEAIAELRTQWPRYAEAIDLWWEQWEAMLTGEMEGMRHVLGLLKQRSDVRLFGLTNWSMETYPTAREHFGILGMIDDYVVSGAEGLVKPDRRLFERLLQRFGLVAEECIFIDDNPTNVEAARALGMKGIDFVGADALMWELGLWHHPTADEVRLLETHGNQAERWEDLTIADGHSRLAEVRGAVFEGVNRLGVDAVVRYSMMRDCEVGSQSMVERCGLVENYQIGRSCTLRGVGEMRCRRQLPHADVMNENGGRRIGLHPDMTVGDAYLWARYRDRVDVMQRLAEWSDAAAPTGYRGKVGDGSTIENAIALIDGTLGRGCHVAHGVVAERFLLGENVKLEAGLRLNDTVVGDNSTLARGEVGCSLIFPAHEQHHNSSFLIAALTMGQSNVASGATLGSNHNGRTADGELQAGRGFWPGLCTSVKHFSRFASYTLLAKGDYPSELNITLPFALVNNNVAKNRLEVMPAYWWLHNMYALDRNSRKFAARDRRTLRRQHIVFDPLAPDTAEEVLMGRDLLHTWTTTAYHDGGSTEVVAHGMERGRRKTVILHPGEAYKAYGEMLLYYAMGVLGEATPTHNPIRTRRWVNLGGQLLRGEDADQLLDDIAQGRIGSWGALHERLDALWAQYPTHRAEHAYAVLCHLEQKGALDGGDWLRLQAQYRQVCGMVRDRIVASRQKDADNEFRQTTFLNTAEMRAVMGE